MVHGFIKNSRFQSTQDDHSDGVFFFSDKKVNGECNVRNFGRFLFGMSPNVPKFKVHSFTSDGVEFELE